MSRRKWMKKVLLLYDKEGCQCFLVKTPLTREELQKAVWDTVHMLKCEHYVFIIGYNEIIWRMQ